MKAKSGFSWIEVAIVVLFVTFFGGLFMARKVDYEAIARDEKRKIAINAIHYGLEKSFYQENGYYPEVVSAENLTVVDEDLWMDPEGRVLGDPLSDYVYESANCRDGKCREYILKANLEKEDTYIKTNQ